MIAGHHISCHYRVRTPSVHVDAREHDGGARQQLQQRHFPVVCATNSFQNLATVTNMNMGVIGIFFVDEIAAPYDMLPLTHQLYQKILPYP